MLDPATSIVAVGRMTSKRLDVGIGTSQYSPPLGPDDPEVRAMTFNFARQDGVQVIPETIQYLKECKKLEVSFLEALSRSAVPITLVWGVHDMVSPIRVADYVWSAALKSRNAPADYWLIPCTNHYLAHDQAQDIARVIRLALGQERSPAPHNLARRCLRARAGRQAKLGAFPTARGQASDADEARPFRGRMRGALPERRMNAANPHVRGDERTGNGTITS
jgi:hypothetical protein